MKRLYRGIYLAALYAAVAPSLESQTFSANASLAIANSANIQGTVYYRVAGVN